MITFTNNEPTKDELKKLGYTFIAKSVDDYKANIIEISGNYKYIAYLYGAEAEEWYGKVDMLDTLDNIEAAVKNHLYKEYIRDEKLKDLGI